MLVQIDSQKVTIYTENQVHRFPIDKVSDIISLIQSYVENKQEKVYYISEIQECSSEDIYGLLLSVNDSKGIKINPEPLVSDERRWLHATGSGYLNLNNFIFDGPVDLKPLHEIGFEILEKDHQLKNMIRKGLVKVVNAREIKEIRKKYREKIQKQEEELSSIVLDTSVKSLDLKNMSGKSIDAEIIDESELTGDDFETEEEKIAKQLNLKEEED